METNKELEARIKNLEKKINLKKLEELERKVQYMDDVLTKAKARFKALNTMHLKEKESLLRIVTEADNLFVKDLSKRYGFTDNYMYYIGVGSGRMFKAKTNDEILELIQNIDKLDWRGIQKINKYFIKNTKTL